MGLSDRSRPGGKGKYVLAICVAALLCHDPIRRSIDPSYRLTSAVLDATRNYELMGRADDVVRWAPWMCGDPGPAQLHMSVSGETATHGRKLYSLFARYPAAYIRRREPLSPVGQVIIKESWEPQEIPEGEAVPPPITTSSPCQTYDMRGKPQEISERKERFLPWAEAYGRKFRTGAKSSLFVMAKVGPEFDESDNGWIYGTTDPSGTVVTSAGRVESCMRCHVKAGPDRLFGLRRRGPIGPAAKSGM